MNSKKAEIHSKVAKIRICNLCGCQHLNYVCPECGSSSWHHMRDVEYRSMLLGLTGKNSCSAMSEAELEDVLGYLARFAWDDLVDEEYIQAQRAKKKQISLIFKIGKKALGPDLYESRIKGFMREKLGKKNIWHCDEKELRQIIGWLRRTDMNAKKKLNVACEN